jgi:hypothetical protein
MVSDLRLEEKGLALPAESKVYAHRNPTLLRWVVSIRNIRLAVVEPLIVLTKEPDATTRLVPVRDLNEKVIAGVRRSEAIVALNHFGYPDVPRVSGPAHTVLVLEDPGNPPPTENRPCCPNGAFRRAPLVSII